MVDVFVFEPAAVANLWRKCKARAAAGQFSNADCMLDDIIDMINHQYCFLQFLVCWCILVL